jgi:alpha-tubulin suppressor-like RCC1 family protein
VQCWGLNQGGHLGNGTTIARSGNPVTVNGAAAIVDTGGNHSCAIGASGTITCWGDNFYGQLGHGSGSSAQPVVVQNITNATDIALGFDHTCAVLADHGGRCWGRNDLGQLGINSTSPSQTSTPSSLSLLGDAVDIAAGAYHNCAVLVDGGVQCWGQNTVGQLAYVLGTQVIVTFPSVINGNPGNAVAVTAGFEHSCVLLATGSVLCFGRNTEGQLGNNGGGVNTNTPVTVSGITNAVAIAAGNFHTCALLATREVVCWGRGDEGQLGNGGNADVAAPVDVTGTEDAVGITAGGFHTCLRTSSSAVRCWGRGDLGQVGNGIFANRNTPQAVGVSAIALDAGRSHNCAVLPDGSVQCWGLDEQAQLGDGGGPNSATPVLAHGLSMEAAALAWDAPEPSVLMAMSGHLQGLMPDETFVTARYGARGSFATVVVAADTDADGVVDPLDNCTEHPNPDQRDTNNDQYGNVCDADLDGSGGIVNFVDLALFRAAFGTVSPDADFNGNGGVTGFEDLALFRGLFGKPVGPSGTVE